MMKYIEISTEEAISERIEERFKTLLGSWLLRTFIPRSWLKEYLESAYIRGFCDASDAMRDDLVDPLIRIVKQSQAAAGAATFVLEGVDVRQGAQEMVDLAGKD